MEYRFLLPPEGDFFFALPKGVGAPTEPPIRPSDLAGRAPIPGSMLIEPDTGRDSGRDGGLRSGASLSSQLAALRALLRATPRSPISRPAPSHASSSAPLSAARRIPVLTHTKCREAAKVFRFLAGGGRVSVGGSRQGREPLLLPPSVLEVLLTGAVLLSGLRAFPQ